jgi:hypothetical protein
MTTALATLPTPAVNAPDDPAANTPDTTTDEAVVGAATAKLLLDVAMGGVAVGALVHEALPQKKLKELVRQIHKATGWEARDFAHRWPFLKKSTVQDWIKGDPGDDPNDCFFGGWWTNPDNDPSAISIPEFCRSFRPFTFDPFSRKDANDTYIHADTYCGLDTSPDPRRIGNDGFNVANWPAGSVAYCNPPWKSIHVRNAAAAFLRAHTERGVTGFIVAPTFTEAEWLRDVRDAGHTVAYIYNRPWFRRPNGLTLQGGEWNICVCFIHADPAEHARFIRAFSEYGNCSTSNPAVLRLLAER